MTTDRPTYIIELRAERDCDDPIKALRRLLKRALRDFKLRCVSAVAHAETTEGSSQ